MNYLSLEEVRAELGQNVFQGWPGHSHALLLQNWLEYNAERACWEYGEEERRARFAASLISRADAELYGFSYPRFAIRAYLDNEHTSFLNLRRTTHLTPGILDALLPVGVASDDDLIRSRLMGNAGRGHLPPTIGDCVLRVPERLREQGFQMISCNPGRLYGSERLSLDGVQATTYVNYSDYYGSCALAVIFMASAMMSDFCNALFGLTELPFVLSRALNLDKVTVGCLNTDQVVTLLTCPDVGLSAYHQRVINPTDFWGSNAVDRTKLFGEALQAYILSGMPVLVPCDLHSLHGYGPDFLDRQNPGGPYDGKVDKGIYCSKPNVDCGFRMVPKPRSGRGGNRHFLLAIGALPGNHEFVIHDPYGMPYLQATAKQLLGAAPYRDDDSDQRDTGYFVAVTPPAVALPFSIGQAGGLPDFGGTLASSLGAYRVGVEIARSLNGRDGNQMIPDDDAVRSRFRLIQLSGLWNERTTNALNSALPAEKTKLLRAALGELHRVDSPDWVWLQFLPDRCLVLDAQRAIPGDDCPTTSVCGQEVLDADVLRAGFLLREIKLSTTGVKVATGGGTSSFQHSPSHTVRSTKKIQPDAVFERLPDWPDLSMLRKSIISSFCVTGQFLRDPAVVKSLAPYLLESDLQIELYAFMQKDLQYIMSLSSKHLRLENPYQPDQSVVDNLTTIARMEPADQHRWVKALAHSIDSCLRREDTRILIGGMATFVPGATACEQSRRDRAILAMRVISLVATALREDHGHPVRFIEMVAGSRIGKLRHCASSPTGPFVTAHLEELTQTHSKLAGFLTKATEGIPYEGVYSLEMEPGAMFALSNVRALERTVRFCEYMIDMGVRVGFNLDICHWMLSGSDPSSVTDEILKLVAHAHICDGWKGHMDDSPLLWLRSPEEYTPWLRLLKRRVELHDGPIPFSGLVSLELECAKETFHIAQSIRILHSMLSGPQVPDLPIDPS